MLYGISLLFLVASAYIHQPPSLSRCPTPLSRLDLLHGLAAGGASIDAYATNTPDKATYGGHFYSDKAPGTVALALPAFGVSALGLRAAGVALDSGRGWLISSWLACAGSIAIVAAIGAGLTFAWLLGYAQARPALMATLAVFLGAAPLPYATMM